MSKKELTWDELAAAYKKYTGKNAKIRPMNEVFEWAESRTDLFKLNKDGTLREVSRKPITHGMGSVGSPAEV